MEVQANAQLHVLHLVAVMVRLLPDWVPEPLFELLHMRWLSPERQHRQASLPCISFAGIHVHQHDIVINICDASLLFDGNSGGILTLQDRRLWPGRSFIMCLTHDSGPPGASFSPCICRPLSYSRFRNHSAHICSDTTPWHIVASPCPEALYI